MFNAGDRQGGLTENYDCRPAIASSTLAKISKGIEKFQRDHFIALVPVVMLNCVLSRMHVGIERSSIQFSIAR